MDTSQRPQPLPAATLGGPPPSGVAGRPVPWPAAAKWVYWAAIAVLAASLGFRSVTRYFFCDEVEAIHTAWLLTEGQRPYLDFFQHHDPLLYYVLAPVVAACGESVWTPVACRLVILAFLAGVFTCTYLLAARLFGRFAALLAVLFLMSSFAFLNRAMEVRPDVPQTLFGLMATVLFFRGEGRVKAWGYFFAGVCLGVSLLFLQKAVFTIAALGAVLLYRLARKEARAVDLVACAAGGLLALLPFGVWLVACNSPSEYFFLNWTLNAHSLDRVAFLPVAMMFYDDSTLLFVFAAIGVAVYPTRARHRELAAVAALLVALLLVVRAPFEHYWIPIVPVVAVLAGQGLAAAWRDRPRLAAVFFAFVLVGPAGTWVYQQARGNYISLWKNWEKSAYVLSLTARDNRVYDGLLNFNFFRHDIDYIWFLHSGQLENYQSLRPHPYDIYELISKERPKVISSYKIANLDDPRIRDHYRQSDRYDDLFIRRD